MVHPIRSEHVKEAAAETSLTTGEVERLLEEFNEGLNNHLLKLLRDYYLPLVSDRLLSRGEHDTFTFALTTYDFSKYTERSLSSDETIAIQIAHQNDFLDFGVALSVSPTFARAHDLEALSPVCVATSEDFSRGRLSTQYDIRHLMLYGLNPSEALDYHMIEDHGYEKSEWINERGVGREAVNKNLRSARSKLQEEGMRPEEMVDHPNKKIDTIPAEKVEDGVIVTVRDE